MPFNNRRSALFATTAVLIAALLIALGLQLRGSQANSREVVLERFDFSVADHAALVSALFGSSSAASAAELTRELGGGSIPDEAIERRVRQDGGTYAVVVDAEGTALAASRSTPAGAVARVERLPPHVQAALGPQSFGLSDAITDPNGKSTVEFAQGFAAADSSRRVFVSSVDPDILAAFLGGYLSETQRLGEIFITDSRGVVIAATTESAGPETAEAEMIERALESETGELGEYRFTSKPIDGTSWKVVATARSGELLGAIQGPSMWMPWLALAGFGMAACAALFLLLRALNYTASLAAVNTELEDSNVRLEHQRRQLAEAQTVGRSGSWEWNIRADTIDWSDGLYRIYGIDRDGFDPSFEGYLDIVHQGDRELVAATVQNALDKGGEFSFQHRIMRRDGEVRTLQAHGETVRDDQGEPVLMRGAAQDITAQKSAEERFRGLLESAPDAMVIADDGGRIVIVNSQTLQLFGYSREELIGQPVEILVPERLRHAHHGHRASYADDPQVREMGHGFDLYARRKDGSEFAVEISLSPLKTDQGVLVSSAIRDITARKRAEADLEHQALHDSLTGLPNRVLLLDRLQGALNRARRPGSTLAVFFCDLDEFKAINDSLGHGAGDALLAALTPRLAEAVRPEDTIARFGGDEFVVLCEGLGTEADASRIATRISDAISKPIDLDGVEHFVSVSTGVVIIQGGFATVTEVLRDADAAMYQAKAKGRGRYEIFDQGMRKRLIRRLDTENALRTAVEHDELELYYQPVVDLSDLRVSGAEALLRWERPGRGLQQPDEFIEIAEDSGLVVPIGRWVLEEACRQTVAWNAEGSGTPIGVSVNLSPRQVAHPEIVATVAEVMRETGMEPGLLALEITEGALIGEAEDTLQELKSLGVRLLLDDFGTGYSSLSYLKRFPIDVLKIDRSFIDGLGTDPGDSTLVAAIVRMAHSLEIGVIAEGIETPLQLSRLGDLGCEQAQGYLFSPPLPREEFKDFPKGPPGDTTQASVAGAV